MLSFLFAASKIRSPPCIRHTGTAWDLSAALSADGETRARNAINNATADAWTYPLFNLRFFLD